MELYFSTEGLEGENWMEKKENNMIWDFKHTGLTLNAYLRPS